MRERRKTYTVTFQNAQGATAVSVPLSFGDDSDIDLEVWQAGGVNNAAADFFGPVWILAGKLDTATAANQVSSTAAIVDCICAVPRAGVARVSLDEEVRALTVYLESGNAGGMSQSVCITVIECVRDRVSLVDSR